MGLQNNTFAICQYGIVLFVCGLLLNMTLRRLCQAPGQGDDNAPIQAVWTHRAMTDKTKVKGEASHIDYVTSPSLPSFLMLASQQAQQMFVM